MKTCLHCNRYTLHDDGDLCRDHLVATLPREFVPLVELVSGTLDASEQFLDAIAWQSATWEPGDPTTLLPAPVAWEPPMRTWEPGDSTILPDVPDDAYPAGATPLETRLHDVTAEPVEFDGMTVYGLVTPEDPS